MTHEKPFPKALLDKKVLRSRAKELMQTETLDSIREQSLSATHQLMEFLKSHTHSVRTLGLYAPLADEVQWNASLAFREFLEHEIKSGMSIAFPLFSADENAGMKFIKCASLEMKELQPIEVFQKKMLVPSADENLECTPDCLIIPGLGFDSSGFRLGRGKGYYDRYLLGKTSLKIGLTFDSLFLSEIPCGDHDIQMDVVITESGVKFKK